MKNSLFILSCCFCLSILAQQSHDVDFLKAKVDIFVLNFEDSQVAGQIEYEFLIKNDVDSIYLDAKNFTHSEVMLNNGGTHEHEYNGKHIIIRDDFKANSSHKLMISWITTPKKALYFVERPNKQQQIWTQGQGKYTSNWMPSIDDMNEKIEFDLSISYKNGYDVIANGQLVEKDIGEKHTRWDFNMNQPMASYLLAFVVGKFDKKIEYSNSGIPLEMYYYPEDSTKFEPTYRYSKKMFDFLENQIGIPYPWQNYKQVPVHDFLYAGMENTSLTIFSDRYVVDSIGFNDYNYVNVNAHELAHQWFGNMVTATSGTHHWLQEGFATYYALLVEKQAFGVDYFYWKLYESAQQLYIQEQMGQGTRLLDPNSSSLTFYQKGAWTLFMLNELIGETAFKEAIQNYLNANAFKNVNTSHFIKEAEKASGRDLSEFTKVWLETTDFPIDRALDALKLNSVFIQEYLMVDCEVDSSKCDDYLLSGISDEAKVKLIAQNPKKINAEVFKSSYKVRQAIAENLREIPETLKQEYESLLLDKSYITIENALFNLWNNFPKDRMRYLSQTKSLIGLNNKNIRLLWLLLASITTEYDKDSKVKFIEELRGYTGPKHNFEIRMTAFQYLKMIDECNFHCLENLEQAKGHFNWQLSKFAKNLIKN